MPVFHLSRNPLVPWHTTSYVDIFLSFGCSDSRPNLSWSQSPAEGWAVCAYDNIIVMVAAQQSWSLFISQEFFRIDLTDTFHVASPRHYVGTEHLLWHGLGYSDYWRDIDKWDDRSAMTP